MPKDILLAFEDGSLRDLDSHVESFLKKLMAAGYARTTWREKQRFMASFTRWVLREQVAITDLDESHVSTYLKCTPRGSKKRRVLERATVHQFLEHLRAVGGAAPRPLAAEHSLAEVLEGRYVDHLRHERGLSERSIKVYSPLIRDFLTARLAAGERDCSLTIDASVVRDFLLDRARTRSSEYTRLFATALRSFLRFLFLRGETATDLSIAVPTVRRWKLAAVPSFLSPEEVEHVLAATDRTTSRGRRSCAILLLLARLGLRAGEVVALELKDIRWRTGELLIRGKGQVLDRLPLLEDVGEALALYIKKDRGFSTSRRVFLRACAPRVGLSGPTAVCLAARAALHRAGLRRAGHGAAHVFRHSLATRMIRQGASLAEISQILRHRSTSTTQIYAKVAFETLRGVARPWPGMESVR